MPIRRSKSVLGELYRRINRLIKEQRRRQDTGKRTGEVKQRLTDLFRPADSKKQTDGAGRSKARPKN
jgi:hypothetical protein